MNLTECLSRFDIALRLGNTDAVSIPASKWRDAVVEFNRPVRMNDFPDEWNPLILDAERTLAFLDGFPRLETEVLEKMRNGVIALEGEGLRLPAPFPIPAERLRNGFSLEVVPPYFARFQAPVLIAKPDLDLAATRAAEAKAATAVWDGRVREVDERIRAGFASSEEHRDWLGKLAQARNRRYAAAWTWRCNLGFIADPAEAAEAVEAFFTPLNRGMPGSAPLE